MLGVSVLTGLAAFTPAALFAQTGPDSNPPSQAPANSVPAPESSAPTTPAPPPAVNTAPSQPANAPANTEAAPSVSSVPTTSPPSDATAEAEPPSNPSPERVSPAPDATSTTPSAAPPASGTSGTVATVPPTSNSVAVGASASADDVEVDAEASAPEAHATNGTSSEPNATQESPSPRASGNMGAQFDQRPYSRPVVYGFGYGGFVQAQYLNSQLSEDQLQQGNVPLNRDQFSLRSARLRVEQGYEYTAFGLELDATTLRSPMLSVRRAEATLLYQGDNPGNLTPIVALSAGVVDIPFGFEVAESVRTRVFMERSVASSAFFPTQNDVGVRLFGAWRFARYAFALVSGEPFAGNAWPSDPNAAKDIIGRLGAEGEVTEKIGLSGGASFAFGKGFHAGRHATKDTLSWRDDNEDSQAQAPEIIAVPGASASPSENFERFAIGVDLGLQVGTPLGWSRLYGEVYVASNHDRGLFVSNPVVSGVDVRQLGGYVAFTQDLSPYAFVGVRTDFYDPNSDFFEQRRGVFVPETQTVTTWSPVVGLAIPRRARLIAQYDIVKDYFGRDKQGVPSDAKNNQLTVRLQVEL